MGAKKLIILSAAAFLLIGCAKHEDISSEDEKESTSETKATYNITWRNDDGSILKSDTGVKEGSMPSYNGTPTKEGDAKYEYVFSGWDPALAVVTSNQAYTATYDKVVSQSWKISHGVVPMFDEQASFTYGLYPPEEISDEALIETLSEITPTGLPDSWVEYNYDYYATFNSKWFACKPVEWKVVQIEDNETETVYTAISTNIIDGWIFDNDRNDNVYSSSDIKVWLNQQFYNSAFYLGDEYLKAINSGSEKISLPSEGFMNNAEYGFNGNSDRIAEDTDYAKARQYNTDLQIYWTSSIKNGTYVLVVNGLGSLN